MKSHIPRDIDAVLFRVCMCVRDLLLSNDGKYVFCCASFHKTHIHLTAFCIEVLH
jgi:hypothetical protein